MNDGYTNRTEKNHKNVLSKRRHDAEEHILQNSTDILTQGTFAGSGDILLAGGGCSWVEAGDAANHPPVHRPAPCNKELSNPEWQRCRG